MADKEAVRTLILYAENDGDLYRRLIDPTHKNLEKKINKGQFDFKKSLVSFRRIADAAAQGFTKEHDARGSTSFGVFGVAERNAAARELALDFAREHGYSPKG